MLGFCGVRNGLSEVVILLESYAFSYGELLNLFTGLFPADCGGFVVGLNVAWLLGGSWKGPPMKYIWSS